MTVISLGGQERRKDPVKGAMAYGRPTPCPVCGLVLLLQLHSAQ
jgi:hypothetical protein